MCALKLSFTPISLSLSLPLSLSLSLSLSVSLVHTHTHTRTHTDTDTYAHKYSPRVGIVTPDAGADDKDDDESKKFTKSMTTNSVNL